MQAVPDKLIRASIISRAISNMDEFGYKNVSEKELFNDYIISKFFMSMLKDSMGQGYDIHIQSIMNEIKVTDEANIH